MNPSPHRDLGLMWLERGRPEKAVEELRQALTHDPDDALAHAYLAAALLSAGTSSEALAAAESACGLAPDWALPHRIRSQAYIRKDKLKDAEEAAAQALRLDGDDSSNHAAMAQVLARRKRWREALAAAQAGLEIDPEDTDCLNLRARSLIELGEAEAADLTLGTALSHDPENPSTHLNLGWAKLTANKPDEAIEHYLEALRLDPTSNHARAGLVEALKARNFIYRLFLKFFMFIARLPPAWAFACLIGTVFARGIIAQAATSNPGLGFVLWPLYWAMVGFVLMSWIAVPLFNLTLRLNRQGRHALSDRQLSQSNWLLALLLASGSSLLMWMCGVPFAESSAPLMAAGFLAALTIPVMGVVDLETPRLRRQSWLLVFVGLAGSATFLEHKIQTWWADLPDRVVMLPGTVVTDPEALETEIAEFSEHEKSEARRMVSEFPTIQENQKSGTKFTTWFIYAFVAWTWGFHLISKRDRPD